MKKICILTLGSRGDVQPYIPLAKGLLAAGHDVHLCTCHEFSDFVAQHGIPMRPIRAGYLSLASSEEGRQMMAGSLSAVIKNMETVIRPMIAQSLSDMAQACADAQVIICHPKAFGAYDIAQAKNIPIITAAPTPVVEAISAFPNPAFFPQASLGAFLNRKSYALNALGTASFTKVLRQWRKNDLGLSPNRPRKIDTVVNQRQTPVLYGISPCVLDNVSQTSRFCISGYWWLSTPEYQPDAQLAKFVSSGNIVCIGFGSMRVQNPQAFHDMLLDAAKKLDCKVIILSDQSELAPQKDLPDNILVRDNIPHNWLFPKMSVVVHHGGAGTTAACLKAGVPMIICPLMGDQFFWRNRMLRMGTLAESAPLKKLTAVKLVSMINCTLSHPSLSKTAALYAHSLAQEDGVSRAVSFIQTHI